MGVEVATHFQIQPRQWMWVSCAAGRNLEDSISNKQGRMCRLGAWYAFIRALYSLTKHVTARRYHMLVISENCMGTGQAQTHMHKAAEELAKRIVE